MLKLVLPRLVLVVIVSLVGCVFVTQTLGTDRSDTQVSSNPSPAQIPPAAISPADWALAGLVASGGVVLLLRPRKRVEEARKQD